jgi:cysteinyl-tRNA synthetase
VRIDEEKMSKSLGNFFTIRTVLETYPAEALRYFVLSSHYRSPLNYSDANLDQARTSLARLYTALRGVAPAARADAGAMERFRAVMDDDLNTAEALALLQELAGELNRARAAQDDARAAVLAATLTAIGGVLGLLQAEADAWLKSGGMPRGLPAGTEQEAGALADAAIEARISERNLARARKDFAEADRIRDELAAQGVVLEDGPSGTTWRRS